VTTLTILGNIPHAHTITSRLTNAGFTLNAPATHGPADAPAGEEPPRVLLTAFGSAAASRQAAARALPSMAPGGYWIDLSPACDDATSASLAECHGATRIQAPLANHRGVLVATVHPDVDLAGLPLCDLILNSAAHLVIRSTHPDRGLIGLDLEAQLGIPSPRSSNDPTLG
jgi:hypothetical protein